MTKEEYKQHLCTVITAVFEAQRNVCRRNRKENKEVWLLADLVSQIADEMLSATPEDELKQILAQEL